MARTSEDPRPLGAARALGIGFAQALSLSVPTLLLFATHAASVLSGLATMLFFVALVFGRGDASSMTGATIGGLITAWLIAHLLSVLVFGAGLGQAADRITDARVRPAWVYAVSSAQESLPYALVSFALHVVVSIWKWLALITGVWLFARAVGEGAGGFVASAALAFALTVSLPLGFLLSLWLDVALVRAVHHREDFLPALLDTLGVLAKRPWPYAWITLIVGAIGLAVEVAVAAFASLQPAIADPVLAFGAGAYGQLITGLIVALGAAVLTLARLYGYLAIVMDSGGELPSRYKPAPPMLDAIPVSISSQKVIVDDAPTRIP